MILWWILLVILMFLLFFVGSSLHIAISYEGELSVKIRVWFFCHEFVKKEIEKDAQKLYQRTENTDFLDIIKEKKLKKIFGIVRNVGGVALKEAKKLFFRSVIDLVELSYLVVGEDAADTALKYGHLCAAVYPAMGALLTTARCKKHSVNLVPGFEAEKSNLNLTLKMHIRICYLLSAFFSVFFCALKYFYSEKNKQ